MFGESAVKRITVDCTSQPPTGGRELKFQGKYFSIRSVPPGIAASIAFHAQGGAALPITRPETFVFDVKDGRPNTVFLTYTPIDVPGGQTAPLRASIEILIADDVYALPTPERIEVIPAPALGGTTGQFTVAAAAAAITGVGTNGEEVMITAFASNAGPFYIGFDGSVTTATGDYVAPGMVKTYPCDRASRINVIGTAGDKGSFVIPRSRR